MKSFRTALAATVALAGCGPTAMGPAPVPVPVPSRLNPITRLIDSSIAARAATGAVLAVSWRGQRFVYGAGKLALDDPSRPDGHTIYDLASLTKVVATTTLALQAVQEGKLDLDQPAMRYLPAFRGPGKERVTVRHLLTHSSGLRADSPLWRLTPDADSALGFVNAMPLDTAPGRRMVYSDMGAIVLGEVVERVLGGPLDRLVEERITGPLGMASTGFRPTEIERVAATENDTVWRKRVVRGEVHDEKAAWLHGVAGHAGLFGSALDLLTFGEWLLTRVQNGSETAREFVRRQDVVPGSSRALGWDTPSQGSSAGTLLGPGSYGHTGFTGTSMWTDPGRGLVIILLTNRVNPTRNNPRIGPLRIAVADAVVRLLAPEMQR